MCYSIDYTTRLQLKTKPNLEKKPNHIHGVLKWEIED